VAFKYQPQEPGEIFVKSFVILDVKLTQRENQQIFAVAKMFMSKLAKIKVFWLQIQRSRVRFPALPDFL
jgi:hypothetical protein